MTPIDPRRFLRQLFDTAVAAAQPAQCLPAFLPPPPKGRLVVVGAGKAAAAMAATVARHWRGRSQDLSGVVVTRHGQGAGSGAAPGAVPRITVLEAAHPTPDAASVAAARQVLQAVQGLTADDQVLALISGGGSALLAAPTPGLSLDDKRQLTQALLQSGASIDEINVVRKHLSTIKGGRLAVAAWPAPVLTLAISDVPGDDPGVIASGPTVADASSCADALDLIARYQLPVPQPLLAALAAGRLETPKPGDARLTHCRYQLIASPATALAAAAEAARAAGITPLILGDAIEGEAREVARVLAGIALSVVRHGQPLAAPCVLLCGGETTVSLGAATGTLPRRGGRNSELALALALALQGQAQIHALAADTDGIDGSEDNAGAWVQPDTLARATRLGLNARASLDAHDAWGYFAALDDLLVCGPTDTNVNDFRAVLILPPA